LTDGWEKSLKKRCEKKAEEYAKTKIQVKNANMLRKHSKPRYQA
jgi:hypothetical protein